MDFIKQHKLIVIIAVILLVGGVWFGMSSSSAPASGSVLTGANLPEGGGGVEGTLSAAVSSEEQDIVTTLLALRAVKLDSTIFSDPGFMALRDFSIQIVSEPVGRPNPFAPLPSQVAAQQKANQKAAPKPSNKLKLP